MDTDRATTARRGRGDQGFTLVEVLVTVVLLGIGVIAVLGAILTVVSTSARHRDLSDAAALAAASGERVAAAPMASCASDMVATYTAAAQPPPGERGKSVPRTAAVDVTAVGIWDGNGPDPFDGTCPLSGSPPQRVTLRVVTGEATETLEVVKWA